MDSSSVISIMTMKMRKAARILNWRLGSGVLEKWSKNE